MDGIRPDKKKLSIKKKSQFLILFYLVYILIMFSGSTIIKPIVPHLVILYLVVCFCMAKTTQGKRAAVINRKWSLLFPFILVQLFVLFLVFQYRFAYVPTIVMVYIRRYFVFAFMFLFIPRTFVFKKAIWYSKIYSIAAAVSILIMAAAQGKKTGGLVGDFQSGGMMMSIACIIFLIEYFENQKNKLNNLGFILCLAGLMVSGKRMFTLIVLISFYIIFRNTQAKKRYKRFLEGIVAGLIGIILVITVIPSTKEVLNRFVSNSGRAISVTSGRNILWQKAMIAFMEHKTFGIGFGAFQTYFGDHYKIPGIGAFLTHNIYIGLLAETGIVGTVIYVSFMLVCLISTLKLRKTIIKSDNKTMRYVYLYSLLLQSWFIIYGFTGNGIYDTNETFFYFSAIAMMLSLRLELKNGKFTQSRLKNKMSLSKKSDNDGFHVSKPNKGIV